MINAPQDTSIHMGHVVAPKRSIVKSLAQGTAGVAGSVALATLGVAMMSTGFYSAYITYDTTNHFYWSSEEHTSGYQDFPFFTKGCSTLKDLSHTAFGYPEKTSTFCNEMATKSFDELTENRAGVLATSLATAAIGGLGGLFLFTGGLACVGNAIKLFNWSVWGN